MRAANAIPGSRGGQSAWAKFVSVDEQYGSQAVEGFLQRIPSPANVMDVGAGSGRDLSLVKAAWPAANTIAVDCVANRAPREMVDEAYEVDIERAALPAGNESLDLVIANQVFEHLKEIFWAWHEASRVLKVGGHFILGVPNLASLHNRGLLLAGRHPTQWKSYSAHVRPFSKHDTLKFLEVCFPGGYELKEFRGAQFYPLPLLASRAMCKVFPNSAAFIFFLFQKKRRYNTQFLDHPRKARLETNFYLGPSDA